MSSSQRLSYDVVDVFTDRAYAGNPLAVVHGAGDLDSAALQALAREFNLSETAFPTPRDEHAYDLRIFTPELEVPFAGHPSVGTAWVLARRGELAPGPAVQHCGAGEVGLEVSERGAELSAAVREVGEPLSLPWLLAAAAVAEGDLLAPVRAASCGLGFVYARVSADAVRRSRPVGPSWKTPPTGLVDPLGGLVVYAADLAQDGRVDVLARVYCPEAGVPEDPATGSAAAALGAVLVADGVLPDGGSYQVEQGAQVGRPSLLRARVEVVDRVASRSYVGGGVVAVASGSIVVPG